MTSYFHEQNKTIVLTIINVRHCQILLNCGFYGTVYSHEILPTFPRHLFSLNYHGSSTIGPQYIWVVVQIVTWDIMGGVVKFCLSKGCQRPLLTNQLIRNCWTLSLTCKKGLILFALGTYLPSGGLCNCFFFSQIISECAFRK